MMTRRAKRLLPFGVLGLGFLGAYALHATAPEVKTVATQAPAPLVRVASVRPEERELTVITHGTVAPRTESDLVPEVSGSVVWVSPALVSGGFFESGEPLLRIDQRDYEVALERARASLARARSEHNRAKKELARRKGLAERQVASASQLDDALNAERVTAAALREARAALEKAERDLERTEVTAPFAGRVRDERVDVGQFVNRGASIARLYAVDYAEVRLPIPDDELAYLELPLLYRGEIGDDAGAEVLLRARFAGGEHTWQGRIVRTEGEIDPKSRMVHVVARVDDPYRRTQDGMRPPLAVGLFVEAEIKGQRVQNVVVLPRAAMRGLDQVLVLDQDSRLRFRRVDVLRAGHDQVVIRPGLAPGEKVCVSPIETVIDGMRVREASASPAPEEEAG
jgi:RND family efflux transporter MFP subunit